MLAIYCSHAVRKGRKENRQSKWEGIGQMPTPTPKDTIKTLRINSLKALRVLTTIQVANLTESPHLTAKASAGRRKGRIKEQQGTSQT